MKNSIWTIVKKEFARFFGDKRLFITTVILPGVMIYLMYSLMGGAFADKFSVDEEYISKISVINMPSIVEPYFPESSVVINKIDSNNIESEKAKITSEKSDLLIIFPDDFDEIVPTFDATKDGAAPNVEIYYSSTITASQNAYYMVKDILSNIENSMSNKFDLNNTETRYDLASEKESSGMMFAMLMPMLLMIFLFQACMAVAPESIAGEKERGTIATLLITPIKRSDIAIGKIISLAVISLLSGLSSALGTMLSLPKMMNFEETGASASVYSIGEYILLGAVIVSTILFLVTIVSIISANAKTIKEAQTSTAPLMFIVTILGVTSMFGSGAQTNTIYYALPFYNSLQCMSSIFTFKAVQMNVITTIISNVIYTGIGIVILAKMFKSEKVMFNR